MRDDFKKARAHTRRVVLGWMLALIITTPRLTAHILKPPAEWCLIHAIDDHSINRRVGYLAEMSNVGRIMESSGWKEVNIIPLPDTHTLEDLANIFSNGIEVDLEPYNA